MYFRGRNLSGIRDSVASKRAARMNQDCQHDSASSAAYDREHSSTHFVCHVEPILEVNLTIPVLVMTSAWKWCTPPLHPFRLN